MQKLVSVVIASYNHEKYISDAIHSVLNQTYQNLELIVMDDASTDHTVEILKKIKDKRLKKIYSKKNQGTVRTINQLIQLCHGDYLAVLGSDDIWYPEKLEKQVKCLEEKNVDACFSQADIIDENGEIYSDQDSFSEEIFHYENMSQGKRMRLFYEVGNHLCHPSSLVTRKVIEKIGLYNCSYRQLHDFEYWVRLINQFQLFILDEKLLGYRRLRNGNLSSSTNSINLIRHMNEHYHIIQMMFEIMDDQLFIEGFQDLFIHSNASTKNELFCEKFFLLLNLNLFGVHYYQIAFHMLFNCPNIEEIFDILEKKYHYSLNDFYQDTGKLCKLYPFSLVSDVDPELKGLIGRVNYLEEELTRIYSSKSWAITKPLRNFMGRMKK